MFVLHGFCDKVVGVTGVCVLEANLRSSARPLHSLDH